MEWTLYVDLDAYYVACELRDRPELVGRRVLVGPDPSKGPTRGVVLSASYEARAFGARSAMPAGRAGALVPDAVWIRPDFEKYGRVAHEVREVLRRYAARVVPLSIDEAAVVIDRPTAAEAGSVAREIQAALRTELRLSASIGVSPYRIVAKIASDREKPGGIVVVPPETTEEFLAPLPVRAVPGVGPKTEARLREAGVRSIGELRTRRPSGLRPYVGAFADELVRLANGRPSTPIEDDGGPRSRSVDHTFPSDIAELDGLLQSLPWMAESLAETLTTEHLAGLGVGVGIRWADFTQITRSRSTPHAVRSAPEILAEAERLVRVAWLAERAGTGRPVRRLSLRVERLRPSTGRLRPLDSEVPAPLN